MSHFFSRGPAHYARDTAQIGLVTIRELRSFIYNVDCKHFPSSRPYDRRISLGEVSGDSKAIGLPTAAHVSFHNVKNVLQAFGD